MKFYSSLLIRILFFLTMVIPTHSSYLIFLIMLESAFSSLFRLFWSISWCWSSFSRFSIFNVLGCFLGFYGLKGLCCFSRLISFSVPPLFTLVWNPFVLNMTYSLGSICSGGGWSFSYTGCFHCFFCFLYLYECLLKNCWLSFVYLFILYFNSEKAGLFCFYSLGALLSLIVLFLN